MITTKDHRVSKLEKSKFISLKKLNGWNYFLFINIDRESNKIELFAGSEIEKRVTVKKRKT